MTYRYAFTPVPGVDPVIVTADAQLELLDGRFVPLEDAAPAAPKDRTVAELKAEIDRRNEGREEDAKLSKDGNKATLLAVLEADDAGSAGA